MIKDLLQGKPFGHPLHTMLVHFPIALLLASFLFDVAALTWSDRFVRPALYAMALGVVGALLAAAPGFVDYSDIRRDHPGRKTATWHMILNLVAVALYLVNLALRWPRVDESRIGALPLLLSLIGVGLLSVSGYLGGVLVYDQGIGVGRHRRKGKIPRETIVKAGIRDEWIEVADSSSLHDGQTVRATINGVTMAIVSVNGHPCAFQEFCTHRYGPLSEGALHDGQVTCPWHGSCFDVKSGEVKQGPAKESIRTFEAQIREGKIHVRAPEP